MKALLLVAHGSRRKASNDEVLGLARALGEAMGDRFDIVEGAFLELAAPTIPDGIRCCVNQGADAVVVVPYFLAAGTHVADDIPALVREAAAAYPDISLTVTPHIGASPLMTDLIRECASA